MEKLRIIVKESEVKKASEESDLGFLVISGLVVNEQGLKVGHAKIQKVDSPPEEVIEHDGVFFLETGKDWFVQLIPSVYSYLQDHRLVNRVISGEYEVSIGYARVFHAKGNA